MTFQKYGVSYLSQGIASESGVSFMTLLEKITWTVCKIVQA